MAHGADIDNKRPGQPTGQEFAGGLARYAQIRRQAVAMLQATDAAALAAQASPDQAGAGGRAEGLDERPASYWLEPSLAALTAWMRDDRQLAQKALLSSWRVSPENTLLFFALVLRQAGRSYNACLDTYLDMALQNQGNGAAAAVTEENFSIAALNLADEEQLRDTLAEELKARLNVSLEEEMHAAKVGLGAYMEAGIISFLALAGGIAGLTPAFLLLLAPVGLLAFQFRRARRAREAIWQKFADLGQQWAAPQGCAPEAMGGLKLEAHPAPADGHCALASALPAWDLLAPNQQPAASS